MKLLKNYFFNLVVMLLQVGTSLVTIPYVSRIFVPELMGTGVFAASVAKWMVIFAQVGITTYGIRAISTSSQALRLKRFWQLVALNSITTLIISLIYCLGVIIWAKNPLIFWIQGLLLFLNFFEIGWYFSGIQNFKAGLYRSLVTKGISLVLVFTVVKTKEDFPMFLLIQSGSIFLGTMFNFGVGPSFTTFKISFLNKSHILYHLIKARSFLSLAIFINIYSVLDKIFVGVLSDNHTLGLYEMTYRVILTLMVFSISSGGVMLPKSAVLLAEKKTHQWSIFIEAGLLWAFFSSFLISSFMILFYKEFVTLFLGSKYLEIQGLMIFVSPLVLLLSLNNVTGQQILIPLRKEKLLNRTVWVSAFVSVVVNLGLVPFWGAVGALISWVLTEIACTSLQFFYSREFIDMKGLFKTLILWSFTISFLYLFQLQVLFKVSLLQKVLVWLLISLVLGIGAVKKLLIYRGRIKFGHLELK